MSSLSNSVQQTQEPVALKTSLFLMPFVTLAQVSHRQLQEWGQSSHVLHAMAYLVQGVLRPVQQKLEGLLWLHEGLKWMHWLSAMAIFVLAAFADTSLIGAVTVGSFGLFIVRALIKPMPLNFNVVDGLVVLFFLTAVLATAFSSYVQTSMVGLAKFMVFFAGYWNFRMLVGENRSLLWWMLALLVVVGFGESLIGFYQYVNRIQPLATWQDPSINPEDQMIRIFGTLKPNNPNLLAGFLIPCVAGGIGLTLVTLAKRQWLLSLSVLGMSMASLMALVLTGSRGGYLAIAAMILITFLYLGHLLWHEPELRKKYQLKALWIFVLAGVVLAAAFALMTSAPLRARVTSMFTLRGDSSNSYRMNVWMSAVEMIKDNWLVGIGPGNETFKHVYGLYMIPGYNALSAYSIFLEMWVEQGILGIIAFALLIITMMLRSALSFYTAQPLVQKITIGFLLAGVVGSVIYGLFDTIWYRPSVNLLFWLFVAGLSVYSSDALERMS
jgi:putative inorganic carbon (hco3(-)) transporter